MNQTCVTADEVMTGSLLVIAPHMDDEILGCGGLMLRHKDKRRLHCIYVSDSSRSPEAPLFWQRNTHANLAGMRKCESGEALAEVGMQPDQAVFLNMPDGGLSRLRGELERRLEHEINLVAPDFILVPFRYDLHSDHVAVHRAAWELKRSGRVRGTVLEYFVYIRWRLIEGRDIRRRILRDKLVEIDISSVSAAKRRAMSCYHSQTSRLFDWQETPTLTGDSIQQRCREPEFFLVADPAESLLRCFSGARIPVLLAHFLQRLGKRRKDQLKALSKWARQVMKREKKDES